MYYIRKHYIWIMIKMLLTILCAGSHAQGMMFFSFGVNFFSKLNAHPHDSWVGIINRMELDVFQYKLLIIPSNQDNHKSLFVVTGLQNVVNMVAGLALETTLAYYTYSQAREN